MFEIYKSKYGTVALHMKFKENCILKLLILYSSIHETTSKPVKHKIDTLRPPSKSVAFIETDVSRNSTAKFLKHFILNHYTLFAYPTRNTQGVTGATHAANAATDFSVPHPVSRPVPSNLSRYTSANM